MSVKVVPVLISKEINPSEPTLFLKLPSSATPTTQSIGLDQEQAALRIQHWYKQKISIKWNVLANKVRIASLSKFATVCIIVAYAFQAVAILCWIKWKINVTAGFYFVEIIFIIMGDIAVVPQQQGNIPPWQVIVGAMLFPIGISVMILVVWDLLDVNKNIVIALWAFTIIMQSTLGLYGYHITVTAMKYQYRKNRSDLLNACLQITLKGVGLMPYLFYTLIDYISICISYQQIIPDLCRLVPGAFFEADATRMGTTVTGAWRNCTLGMFNVNTVAPDPVQDFDDMILTDNLVGYYRTVADEQVGVGTFIAALWVYFLTIVLVYLRGRSIQDIIAFRITKLELLACICMFFVLCTVAAFKGLSIENMTIASFVNIVPKLLGVMFCFVMLTGMASLIIMWQQVQKMKKEKKIKKAAKKLKLKKKN